MPRSAEAARPAPLIVLLPGAGGGPAQMIAAFRSEAERYGIVLVAPAARGRTWDLLIGRHDRGAADPLRVSAAVAEIRRRVPVDPARVALAGFSDGASYALALGAANPEAFPAILALSPGMAPLPERHPGAQRVFVAHGRADPVLPFGNVAATIVPALRRKGLDVAFRPFNGRHEMPPAIRSEAVRFLLRRAGSPAAPP